MWSNVRENNLEGPAFIKEAEEKVALIRKDYSKLRVSKRVTQITEGENSVSRKEILSTSRYPQCAGLKYFK